jgi:preprotein translocase subunit YajC
MIITAILLTLFAVLIAFGFIYMRIERKKEKKLEEEKDKLRGVF